MNSFAAIKRRAQQGVTLTMTKYSIRGVDRAGALVGVPRKVELVQGNAICFEAAPGMETGSYLYWPEAKDVQIIDDNEFVITRGDIQMTYRFQ